MNTIEQTVAEFNRLGIRDQLDYEKLYLYSIITHSTAIEGSTVTEIENQLLFDDGISPNKPILEQLMNLDLKKAYEYALKLAAAHEEITISLLCKLSGMVMKNTGGVYNTMVGEFDSSAGDLRLVNVSAGRGGKSYMSWQKVEAVLKDYCDWLNDARKKLTDLSVSDQYTLSFEAHYKLVQIHPWADGNGRIARLVMNMIQYEAGLIPSIVKREAKADYIQSLVQASEQNTSAPFQTFMLHHHTDNLQQQIQDYKWSLAS